MATRVKSSDYQKGIRGSIEAIHEQRQDLPVRVGKGEVYLSPSSDPRKFPGSYITVKFRKDVWLCGCNGFMGGAECYHVKKLKIAGQ